MEREDGKNTLSSAQGEEGVCPTPQLPGIDSAYTPRLQSGDFCVQLLIKDGGQNDAYDRKNGVIADPGGVAVAIKPDPVEPPVKSSSGGGSINFILLMILLSLYGIGFQ